MGLPESDEDARTTALEPVRILGIDPGSRMTGFGIIDYERSQVRCVTAGTLSLAAGELGDRLLEIHTRLTGIIAEYRPTEVALEQVFMHRNARSALILGQARGAAVVAALGRGLRLYEYAPNRIKQAVTGRGHAAKEQVQHMVKMLLSLDDLPATDAADALAAAICHAHIRQTGVNRVGAGSASQAVTGPRRRTSGLRGLKLRPPSGSAS